jgi:cytochrome c1
MQMPFVGAVLQPGEAEDLVAYLRSLHEEEKDTKKQ